MANGRESETIELEVKDFGPIVEAKVDLRPFTVFVGPSNTGKSYLAILIYALHRFFEEMGARGDIGVFPPNRWKNESWSKEDRKTLADWAEQASRDVEDLAAVTHFVPPRPIIDAAKLRFRQQADRFAEEIRRYFGAAEQASLIRNGPSRRAYVRLGGWDPAGSARPECVLEFEAKSAGLETTISESTKIRIGRNNRSLLQYLNQPETNINKYDDELRNNAEEYFMMSANRLINVVSRTVTALLRPSAYYLPADRTGIMHAHASVVGAVVQSASMTGLRRAATVPTLSGVLADFLDRLIQIDQPDLLRRRRRWRPEADGELDRGAGIENAILDGAVRVERGAVTGYPSFFYRPKGWKRDLPLMNASSMVSELAPVVLFLRHAVEPGDLLIVEEPESHLHPAKQVEFTRELARLAQAGVRILITTHSEWVLDELANVVQRSYLPAEQRTEAVGGDVALRPDQVGAWLFASKGRPKGSVVKEIEIEKGDRLPSDHDDVALALYNNWAEIVSRQENAE